jgi:hypothetical protein
MKITKFKFSRLLILFFAISGTSFGQAELKTEDLETAAFPPTGWAGLGNINLWSRRTGAQTNPTCSPNGGSGLMRFAARSSFGAGTQQTISSPLMDLSSRGSGNSYFSFYIYRDTVFNQADSLTIYINTSRSLTGAKRLGVVARFAKLNLPDIVTEGWQKYSFAIPASYTGATNYILIQGTARSSGNNGGNVFLDDFEWQHFPTYCSGTPTSGSITSFPTKICAANGQATFTIAGNTSSYGTSIQWQAATTATGTYNNFGTGTNPTTGNLTGTRFIRAIITCSKSGESDTTDYVEVKTNAGVAPTLTVTPNFGSICPGGNPVKLVATASGNSTLAWTPSTGLNTTTGDTVYASPTANQAYTVTATDTVGCVATRNANVILGTNPNITLTLVDSNVCAGDSVRVTAAAGGFGNQYLWSNGKTTAATYAKASGTTQYSVKVTNNQGCSSTKYQNFYEVIKVKASFSYTQNGYAFDFKNISTGGKDFHWFFGDGDENFQENPTHTYSKSGPVEVLFIVNSPPCGGDTFRQYINPQPPASSSANKYLLPGVSVFPNPANDQLNIFIPQEFGNANIQIRNTQGQLITSKNVSTSREVLLNTKNIRSGFYFVEIIANGQKDTYKVQISH